MPLKMVPTALPGAQGYSTAFFALLLGALPVFPALLAFLIAHINGCILLEARSTSCVVFDTELGPLLHTAFASAWVGAFTVLPGFLIATILMIIEWSRNHHEQRRPSKTHLVARYFILAVLLLLLILLLAPLVWDEATLTV